MPAASHSAYAGLVSRLAALGLDVAVLTAAGLAVTVMPGLAWEQIEGDSPGWLAVVSGAVAAALPWAYFTVSWWLAGQTLGDVVIGIVVRRRDGGLVSLPRAALRAFIGLLLPAVWLVGMLAVLWDERRRAWHDRLFRTVVCYAPRVHAHEEHLPLTPDPTRRQRSRRSAEPA